MKSFLAAVVVLVAVSYGASVVLDDGFQTTASQAFATQGVRLNN
ncbi:MAG: hypothetical protein Q7J57_07470 [Gemmobacter sp.]|nr:hypothetical protein [Gemmobacter sp.]